MMYKIRETHTILACLKYRTSRFFEVFGVGNTGHLAGMQKYKTSQAMTRNDLLTPISSRA